MATGRPRIESVTAPAGIRPGHRQLERLLEGRVDELGGDAPDGRRGHAAALGRCFRRIGIVEVAFRDQVEDGCAAPAVDFECPDECRIAIHGGDRCGDAGGAVPHAQAAVRVAQEQSVVGGARLGDQQSGRVRVAREIFQIDPLRLQDFVDDGQHEQPVGARPDADPFVGDGAVAGPARIYRDDLRAARLELSEADLDRVGIVVFGNPEEQEVARVVPIRLAELPERPAQRVEPAGGHVDGAEPAMRRIIGRAELHRPPAG